MSDTPSAPPAFFSASTVPDETYTVTRRQLIDAIANIRIEGIKTAGPAAGLAIADDMADAILSQLGPCEDCGRKPGEPCGALLIGERCIEEK